MHYLFILGQLAPILTFLNILKKNLEIIEYKGKYWNF